MERRDFIRRGALTGLLAGAVGPAADPLAALSLGPSPRRLANGDIRLSSNENPLGISPAARQAVVDAITVANRYPRDQRAALVERLAAAYEVAPDQIVMGVGSSEVLQMAVQAFAGPRTRLVLADPTYEDAVAYQRTHAYEMVKVPLNASYEHDLMRMREAVGDDGRPAVVYICNPNNPTGGTTPSAQVDEWIGEARENVFFIVDEAYTEYVDDPAYHTALPWVANKPNVLVVKTFSKVYGMAGLRLGYGIAHRAAAARLTDFVAKNNTNQLALAAAEASLGDEALIRKSVEVNREAKAITVQVLDELGLEHLPTQTNFIMHRISGDLEQYRQRMADTGLRVGRAFPPMLDWNRLSFGLPEDMERFAETLRDFRQRGWV
ncbi:MAG: aminotransferase class I/II-fold pyridoxal phosphate-dependent enzyme [Gemmatimonadetes bacterium]|nr:aminotransferase class I/II-fold pyridoxal phosphate-dependent enzyme [Gemmatimonadota bacterium]NNM33857.1 aminotransferase class I/II-fold pyridoxal phosphate-dependent enzyme [Gemmatimonadota bacterium]